MSNVHGNQVNEGHGSTHFEPIASLTVHPTLRIIVEARTQNPNVEAEVISTTFRKGTFELEDVLIRIRDKSLASSEDSESIGYDWEALAELPDGGIVKNPAV